MKYIIRLLILSLLVACNQDDKDELADAHLNILKLSSVDGSSTSTINVDPDKPQLTTIAYITRDCVPIDELNNPITVSLTAAPALVEQYNRVNETLLPSILPTAYSDFTATVNFAAGVSTMPVQIKINDPNFSIKPSAFGFKIQEYPSNYRTGTVDNAMVVGLSRTGALAGIYNTEVTYYGVDVPIGKPHVIDWDEQNEKPRGFDENIGLDYKYRKQQYYENVVQTDLHQIVMFVNDKFGSETQVSALFDVDATSSMFTNVNVIKYDGWYEIPPTEKINILPAFNSITKANGVTTIKVVLYAYVSILPGILPDQIIIFKKVMTKIK